MNSQAAVFEYLSVLFFLFLWVAPWDLKERMASFKSQWGHPAKLPEELNESTECAWWQMVCLQTIGWPALHTFC